MNQYKMLINGELVDAASGETYAAINPATGEEFARIPLGGEADVAKAVQAAKDAYPAWSGLPMTERARILSGLAKILDGNAVKLAKMEVSDHGLPIKRALDLGYAPGASFREAIDLAHSLVGEFATRRSTALLYMQYEPIGPCALIIPWNFPLGMVGAKIAPCIAVGNTCVLKPASTDSVTTLMVAEAIAQSEIPPGVVNIITGPGNTVGEALASNPDIYMVSFTGGCEAGKRVMELVSSTIKRVQLELGGKNPFIVLEDADLDASVESGVHAQYLNAGQVCGSPGRYYIHEKVYDKFVEMFIDASKKVIVGDPTDMNTQMGPLVSKEHRDKVESYIESARKQGATIVLGGKRPTKPPLDKGYYMMPTVITNVTQDMKAAREEIFGPVACMIKITDNDDVIALANDSTFGLAASVWTKDIGKGMKMANLIQAGTVWVNGHIMPEMGNPWGGFKQSGLGKDGGAYGIKEYVQLKSICVDLTGLKTKPFNTLP